MFGLLREKVRQPTLVAHKRAHGTKSALVTLQTAAQRGAARWMTGPARPRQLPVDSNHVRHLRPVARLIFFYFYYYYFEGGLAVQPCRV